ncbi:MAG: sporulation membrane protein YtaF [Bacillota bacterium]
MQLIQALILALAVSIDSLAVGMSYGFRRMALTPAVLGIIGLLSAFLKTAAMLLGGAMGSWFSPTTGSRLGAAILVGVGLWFLASALLWRTGPGAGASTSDSESESAIAIFRLRGVGIIIKVLQDPEAADMDNSRSIGGAEAVLLGLALGCDALGVGISAGFLQLPVLPTVAAVAVGTAVFLACGLLIGARLTRELPAWVSRALPGAILVTLGVITRLTG